MKNLKSEMLECMFQLDCIGVAYGEVVAIKQNNRLTSTWGRCRMVSNRPKKFEIEISGRLCGDDVSTEALRDTLMHEVLHTCDGAFNHGNTWKRLADKVNREYGYNIKRCSSCEEKGMDEVPVKSKPYKYFVKCPRCGYTWKYKTMSKVVKNPSRYSCCKCGRSLERVIAA